MVCEQNPNGQNPNRLLQPFITKPQKTKLQPLISDVGVQSFSTYIILHMHGGMHACMHVYLHYIQQFHIEFVTNIAILNTGMLSRICCLYIYMYRNKISVTSGTKLHEQIYPILLSNLKLALLVNFYLN